VKNEGSFFICLILKRLSHFS